MCRASALLVSRCSPDVGSFRRPYWADVIWGGHGERDDIGRLLRQAVVLRGPAGLWPGRVRPGRVRPGWLRPAGRLRPGPAGLRAAGLRAAGLRAAGVRAARLRRPLRAAGP